MKNITFHVTYHYFNLLFYSCNSVVVNAYGSKLMYLLGKGSHSCSYLSHSKNGSSHTLANILWLRALKVGCVIVMVECALRCCWGCVVIVAMFVDFWWTSGGQSKFPGEWASRMVLLWFCNKRNKKSAHGSLQYNTMPTTMLEINSLGYHAYNDWDNQFGNGFKWSLSWSSNWLL